jgi:hypothetical protein
MDHANKTILLSPEDEVYLLQAGFISDDMVRVLSGSISLPSRELSISSDKAKQLGDALTLRLARVGFTETYELSAEGRLLESLIARLS